MRSAELDMSRALMRSTRVKLSQKATFVEVWIEETCLYASVQTFLETKAELLRWICTVHFFFFFPGNWFFYVVAFKMIFIEWTQCAPSPHHYHHRRLSICIHALLRYHRPGTFAVWIRMAVEWICPLRSLVFPISDEETWSTDDCCGWGEKNAVIWWPSLYSTRNGCFGARSFE